MPLSRDNAWNLMTEYTQSESLRKHMNLIQSLFRDTPSLPVSIFWLLVILGASLWFAAVTVDRKEYVLEQ